MPCSPIFDQGTNMVLNVTSFRGPGRQDQTLLWWMGRSTITERQVLAELHKQRSFIALERKLDQMEKVADAQRAGRARRTVRR